MFKNLDIFYSMKLLYVRHFATINEKMTLLCKNRLSLHGKPQKFKCYSLLSKLPIKANDFHKIMTWKNWVFENYLHEGTCAERSLWN